MFEGIGRIGAYTAQQQLKLEAKHKIKHGQSLKDMKASIDQALRESLAPKQTRKTSMSDSTKISIIRQKLRQGRKLSAGELKFLKDTDERLYEKARKAEEAREELQHALKRAKSKEEARRALVQAQMKVAAEAQLDAKGASGNVNFGGAGGAGDLGTGLAGSTNEAASFDGGSINAQFGEGEATAANAPNATANGEGNAESTTPASTPDATASSPAAEARDTQGENSAGKADKESTPTPAHKDSPIESSPKSDGELPGEKYLFMLAALQDEWKKFVNSKEYDELPEWDIHTEEEEGKHSHKPHYGKEKAAADHIISYRTEPTDLLLGDLLDLRVAKEEE